MRWTGIISAMWPVLKVGAEDGLKIESLMIGAKMMKFCVDNVCIHAERDGKIPEELTSCPECGIGPQCICCFDSSCFTHRFIQETQKKEQNEEKT